MILFGLLGYQYGVNQWMEGHAGDVLAEEIGIFYSLLYGSGGCFLGMVVGPFVLVLGKIMFEKIGMSGSGRDMGNQYK